MAFVLEEFGLEQRECMQKEYKIMNPYTGKPPVYEYRVVDEENHMSLVAVATGRSMERVPNVYAFISEDGVFSIKTLERDGMGELHIDIVDISYHELQACRREWYLEAIKEALVVYHGREYGKVVV